MAAAAERPAPSRSLKRPSAVRCSASPRVAPVLTHFSATNYSTGNEIAFPFEPDVVLLLRSLAAGAFVGVLGGFFPALEAARTNPAAAMRV
jgi:hypothetical protein